MRARRSVHEAPTRDLGGRRRGYGSQRGGRASPAAARSPNKGARRTAAGGARPAAGLALGRGRAGDDLEDLLRDAGLADAVVRLGEGLLEVLGVVGRRLHGLHAARELGRDGLLERAEDLAVEVEREDAVEDGHGVLLEDRVLGELLGLGGAERRRLDLEVAVLGRHLEDLVALRLDARGGEGEDRADGGAGRDERHELRVDELDLVRLAVEEVVEHLAGDLRREVGGRHLGARVGRRELLAAAAEVALDLGAHGHDLDLDALGLELLLARLRLLDDVRVVRAAEAAVAGDGEQRHLLHLAVLEEGEVERLLAELLNKTGEHGLERLGEGPGLEDGLLGAAHLGGSDEAHGLRDFLGVADRGDAVAKLAALAHLKRRRRGHALHGGGARLRDERGGPEEACESNDEAGHGGLHLRRLGCWSC
mmetsp:Transcript_1538/g.4991  ORF Transcript_1538/g.4991 Transcript_1538/m.4991 type:complete len:422 (+) Transcript_1538:32-1297(+)